MVPRDEDDCGVWVLLEHLVGREVRERLGLISVDPGELLGRVGNAKAVPVLLEIGRELVYGGNVAEGILREAADDLLREAMREG